MLLRAEVALETSKQFKQSFVNCEGKEGMLFRVSGVFVNFLTLYLCSQTDSLLLGISLKLPDIT